MHLPKELLHLIGVLTTTWLLLLLGVYAIFALIVPLPELWPGRTGIFATAVLKVALSALVALLWLFAMVKLRDLYAKRALG
jgi:hypothetical protein